MQMSTDDGSAATRCLWCFAIFYFILPLMKSLSWRRCERRLPVKHSRHCVADERLVLLNAPPSFTTKFNEVVPVLGFLPVEFWWINTPAVGLELLSFKAPWWKRNLSAAAVKSRLA